MSDSQPVDPLQVFDMLAVVQAGGRPPMMDGEGRSHFLWLMGELTITPSGGPTATCDVTVVWQAGKLLTRRLELGTAGAVELARCLRGILLPKMGAPLDRDSARCLALAGEFPFDLAHKLPEVRPFLSSLPQPEQHDRELLAAAGELLHPWVLRHQCRAGEVVDVPPDADGPPGVVVRYPDVAITFAQGEDPVTSFGEEDTLNLSAAGVSLLLAVQEGVTCVGEAERELELDPDTVDAFRLVLHHLREAVLDDLDPFEGYARLIRLFDPHGRPPASDMSLMQLFALAMTSMRKWIARRAQPSSERLVTLARIRELTGQEPAWTGEEYRLQFDGFELVFDLDDVAVGRLRTVDSTGQLRGGPFTFSAATLEGVVWACAARDVPAASQCEAIDEYLMGAITDPWFDPVAAIAPVVAALEAMAVEQGGPAAAVLQGLVGRAPHRAV